MISKLVRNVNVTTLLALTNVGAFVVLVWMLRGRTWYELDGVAGR